MAYIRYPQIMDEATMKNLFLVQKMGINEVADHMEAPYGCVKNQARKILTDKQFAAVPRKRIRYAVEQKRAMVLEHVKGKRKLQEIADENGVHRELLRTWVVLYRAGRLKPAKAPKKGD